jgi:hypothetical protein
VSKYKIQTVLTNESDERHPGHMFSEFMEDIENWLLRDDGTPDFGAIYRVAQREYGRCQSSIYVDREDGSVRRVGWFFVSRQEYEDTHEPYLRGAWVTILEEIEPARPAEYHSVEVSA